MLFSASIVILSIRGERSFVAQRYELAAANVLQLNCRVLKALQISRSAHGAAERGGIDQTAIWPGDEFGSIRR